MEKAIGTLAIHLIISIHAESTMRNLLNFIVVPFILSCLLIIESKGCESLIEPCDRECVARMIPVCLPST